MADFRHAMLIAETVVTAFILGHDTSGREAFAYIALPAASLADLSHAQERGTAIDLADLGGTVLLHGAGFPTAEQRAAICGQYVFSEQTVAVFEPQPRPE